MTIRAQNQFADSLAHVPDMAPREPRQLCGLTVWQILKPWLFIAVFFISLLALIPVLTIVLDKDFQAQRRVLTPTAGVVLQAEKQPQLAASNSPASIGTTLLKFSFRARQGVTFYGSQVVQNNTPFALLKKGAPLPIVYDSQEPSFNGVDGVLGRNDFPIVLLFALPLVGLFYALMFGWPFFIPLRQTMRARSIYKQGELTVGRVDFVKKKGAVFGAYTLPNQSTEVLYHFDDTDGKTHRSRQKCDNDWLLQKLDVGSQLQIVYLAQKPERCIFLEAFIA